MPICSNQATINSAIFCSVRIEDLNTGIIFEENIWLYRKENFELP
jgi:hypothetical protein